MSFSLIIKKFIIEGFNEENGNHTLPASNTTLENRVNRTVNRSPTLINSKLLKFTKQQLAPPKNWESKNNHNTRSKVNKYQKKPSFTKWSYWSIISNRILKKVVRD